jgi:hypothetical protein
MKASPTDGMGYYEVKHHKPQFDEERSKLLDQMKKAKLQWLQHPR